MGCLWSHKILIFEYEKMLHNLGMLQSWIVHIVEVIDYPSAVPISDQNNKCNGGLWHRSILQPFFWRQTNIGISHDFQHPIRRIKEARRRWEGWDVPLINQFKPWWSHCQIPAVWPIIKVESPVIREAFRCQSSLGRRRLTTGEKNGEHPSREPPQ